MSHKSSTALRNNGAGAALARWATLQGVYPTSPAHQRETHTSARYSFARHEFCEICGLMVKAALRFLFIIGCGILLWGCATVEPWERGKLAQYSMEPDRDPLDTAMAEHVFYTREAAHGGSGLGGGGCGCN